MEGNHYRNEWADLELTFPEAATVLKGDGSSRTYALVGGEHVDVDDPELSYRVTLDFIDAEAELDRYMEALREYESTGGYQVDRFETVELGGHTWCSWFVILHFDYYEELKSQADQVYQSIRAAGR